MKINVFLSLAGKEGKELAEHLKRELEAFEGPHGLRFTCFLYSQDQSAGDRLIQGYLNQLEKCNFFVPVLTPEYCDNRYHVQNELKNALEKEKSIFEMSNGRFRFIFPYAPKGGEQLLAKIPDLKGLIFASDVKSLADAMIKNSAFALLNQGEDSFGFEHDWPRRFFTTNGEPDILLVLGHSGKEDPPEEKDIRNLKICSIEEDLATRYKNRPDSANPKRPTQSMRIAEFFPRLIRFLTNYYLGLKPGSRTVPLLETDIDWHLIKHRQTLLEQYNLICFGAGDTNWISRAVLAYYGTLLPVVFDSPGDSRVIFYRAAFDATATPGKDDPSGRIEIAEYSEFMEQIPADDSQFGAILLLLPNPWNVKKRVIIAAGLTGLGSQASILALCDPVISTVPQGGTPWARVIRGIEGKENKKWQAIDFEVVA